MKKGRTRIITIALIAVLVILVVTLYKNSSGSKDKNNIVEYHNENVELNNKIDELNDEILNIRDTTTNEENYDPITKIIRINSDKIRYNNLLLKENKLLEILVSSKGSIKSYNSGAFTDAEKLNITANVAYRKDNSKFKANSRLSEISKYYIKTKYLNEISNIIFGEDINFKKTGNTIAIDEILVTFPTGQGVHVYKAKSLVLNEKTQEYSLEFDLINSSNIENISEISKPEYINYGKSQIQATYVLKYKKVNGNNIILSLDMK